MEKKKTRKKTVKTSYASMSSEPKVEEPKVEEVIVEKPVIEEPAVPTKTFYTSIPGRIAQAKKDGSYKIWKFWKGNAYRVEARTQEEIDFAESKGFERV